MFDNGGGDEDEFIRRPRAVANCATWNGLALLPARRCPDPFVPSADVFPYDNNHREAIPFEALFPSGDYPRSGVTSALLIPHEHPALSAGPRQHRGVDAARIARRAEGINILFARVMTMWKSCRSLCTPLHCKRQSLRLSFSGVYRAQDNRKFVLSSPYHVTPLLNP